MALLLNIGGTSATTVNQTNISTHNFIGVNTAVNASGNIKSTKIAHSAKLVSSASSITLHQINNAAARTQTFIATYHRLPNYVTINNLDVTMPQFLILLTEDLLKVNSGINTPLTLKSVNSPDNSLHTSNTGILQKSEYLKIAQSIITFNNNNGEVPSYAQSTLGYVSFTSLVYTYSKIMGFDGTNNRLPSYVSLKPLSTTVGKPVYITSDNINSTSIDMARINSIVQGLEVMGLYAVNWGVGSGLHDTILQSTLVPQNALVVDIYGGACAGTIYEMGTRYYKSIKGSRSVFSIFLPPALCITGLVWLPRAYDDNFSPASFTGLVHPDQYLLNNGYQYLYSGNINTIVNNILTQATGN